MKRLLLLTSLLYTVFLQAELIVPNSYNFGNITIGSHPVAVLQLENTDDQVFNISIENYNDNFTVVPSNLILPPHTVSNVSVTFNGEQNIQYDDTVVFVDSGRTKVKATAISAAGRFANASYNNTYNLWDNELKTALHNLVYNHTSLGYDTARAQMYGYIDNENGRVRCVYTGAYYNVSPGDMPNSSDLNCEHTWPQSMGAEGVAKSDLHHLFPTNPSPNSSRGNLPFGIVTSVQNTFGSGAYISKRGTNSGGTTVFEPADPHKGDAARAMYYFSICYDNPNNFLASANQEATFRTWNTVDPVSAYEIARNTQIMGVQHNTNPFVDYPQLVDRIYSFTTSNTRPNNPYLELPLDALNYRTPVNETDTLYVIVVNKGRNFAQLVSATTDNQQFAIAGSLPSTIGASGYLSIPVVFTASSSAPVSASLTIDTNAQDFTIDLYGAPSVSAQEEINHPHVFAVYPNPVRNSLKVNSDKYDEFAVYNIKGQEVGKFNGKEWNLQQSGKKIANGIYFVKPVKGKNEFKKILVLK